MKSVLRCAIVLLCLCALLPVSVAFGGAESSDAVWDPYTLLDFTGEGARERLHAEGIGQGGFSFTENGLLIAGKKKDVKGGVFTIAGTFAFGSEEDDAPVCRVMIDGLAKVGKKMTVRLYLDDQQTPFMEKQLNVQKEKNVWDERNPVFCELAEPIRGRHSIRFTVEDGNSAESEKTAALIRGIRFYRQSGLPTVYVNIDETLGSVEAMNADPKHETRCYGTIVIDVPEGYVSEYGEEKTTRYEGGTYKLEYIRGRGESTWAEAKKPYKIKLENKANLFGMGSSKNWALIANYFDGSFVRNRLTYYLGEAIGLPFTPKLVPVEVVINGEYNGLYFLSETVRVEASRIGIDNLDKYKAGDGNITGGYLISACRKWDADGYLFETRRRSDMQIVSPEELENDVPEGTLQAMYDYMVDYYQKTEDAVFGADGKNADGVHYTEYMDLDSTARYYLIQEFCMNRDAYRTDSTYLFKPRDGKLFWGPLWDFDLCAWGGDSAATYLRDDASAASAAEGFYQSNSWVSVLRGDPLFVEAVRKAWGGKDSDDPTTLRYRLTEVVKDGGLLDRYEAELSAAAEANADLEGYSSREVIALAAEFEMPLIDADFHGEIYRLKRWILARIEWMDENIEALYDPAARVRLTFIDGSETVAVVSAVNGDPVFDFPVPESREGLYFAGWYADAESCDEETEQSVTVPTRFDNGSCFFEDTVFHAKWVTAEDVILPEAIYLERNEAFVRIDKTSEFGYTIMPEGACDIVFLRSSDPSRAYVDQYGSLMIWDMTGDVTITVETINGRKAEYILHIIPTEEQEEAARKAGLIDESHSEVIFSFSVEETELRMKPGEYRKIDIRTDPEDAVKQSFRVLNANEAVAYMTPQGVLVARSEGTAVIFIVHDDKEDAVRLTVTVASQSE